MGIINKYQQMQVVTDPDNYQASQIVQKSSKSGIFTNKRLLVIKNGFLYYFTNVPKNYKTHVPNILSTLKQLPKSSIEIKTIQQIKMESSNSTNLIIKFYEKDMIEREDIRKSISDRNYKYTKKESEDLEEWKFTYSKVLNCRLWYTALLKLKAYFSKQEDKIQEFFNNFDPVKRNSHLPTSNNKDFALNSPKNYRASEIMSQFKKQDEKKQQYAMKQVQKIISTPPESSTQKNTQKEEQPPQLILNYSEQKLQTIDEDEEIVNKKIEDDYREQVQEQIRLEEKKKNEKLIEGIKSELQSKNEKIKILEEAIKATEKLRKKQEDAREKERQKQRERQAEMQRQLEREKQRQKQKQTQREQEETRRRKYMEQQYVESKSRQAITINNNNITPVSLDLEHQRRTVELNQFSVQTDGSQQQFQQSYIKPPRKRNNQSYISGIASTQRDTFNLFRNAGSLSFQFQKKDNSYENYDYYTEVEAMQGPDVKFEQRVKRQIKLINYVNKMKNVALDTFKEYIDTNNPNKCLSFVGTLFQINIVCEHGKIININGREKLVYSNKEHQKLKRQFKIYSYLQDAFIDLTEKRKRFPLRVPLCFLFQYRGYTGLLKYLPYLKPIQVQQQSQRAIKLLSKVVDENVDSYELHLIANRITSLYMVTVKNPYKITKQTSGFQLDSSQLYGPKFLTINRMRGLSTNSTKLQEQIKKISKEKSEQSSKKIMGLSQALLCRALKKLYRSTQPLSFDSTSNARNTDFFTGFLSSPEQICSLVTDLQGCSINGLFVNYFQHFFGLVVPEGFDIYNPNLGQSQFQYEPLSRSFNLSSLYPQKLFKNLQAYISSEKYDIVETAFTILSQLDVQNESIELCRVKYQLKRFSKLDTQSIEQIIRNLAEIRRSTDRHNTIWLQSYMLTIQCQTLGKMYKECLETIYEALGYVTYMFGERESGGYTEDYLCLLVAETLAKMGRQADAMSVYRKLLANKKCSLTQQEISLSIAEVYSNFAQVDPYTLIQFLLSLIKNQNLSTSQVKQQQSTIWQAKIKKFIGLLYHSLGNYDLCIKYLEQSLTYYESNGIKNEEEVNNIVEICLTLFSNYQKKTDKSIIFAKIIIMVEINSQNEKFSVHIVRMIRGFVTACFCHILEDLDEDKRSRLGQVLEELRDGDQIIPQSVHAIAYEDLEKTVIKLIQRSELGAKQAKVMQLLNLSQIQTYLLTSQ